MYKRFNDIKIFTEHLQKYKKHTSIFHLNIRSLRKNFNELMVLLEENRYTIDIIILSEVNIKNEEMSFYQIPGYNAVIRTRETMRGGGILIYVKECLLFNTFDVNTDALESIHGQLKTAKYVVHIIAIYRPPNKNKALFIEQLETMIKSISTSDSVIVIGDTNIDLSHNINPTTTNYKNSLCEYGLQSVIPSSEITREAIVGGRVDTSCLDHVWVRVGRGACDLTSFVVEAHVADHHAVGVSLDLCGADRQTDATRFRKVISERLVQQKLGEYDWGRLLTMTSPSILYQTLCMVFESIYKASTVVVKVHSKRQKQPWVDSHLYTMLVRRDYLFKVWKSDSTNMNKRLQYTKFRNKLNKLIIEAKNKYRQMEITNCKGDFRKIWANINYWLGRSKTSLDDIVLRYLGKTESISQICTNFSKTFTEEIRGIKHNCNTYFLDRQEYVKPCPVSFRYVKVTSLDVEKVINMLSCKKGPGLDGIRVTDIKYLQKQISPVLAKLMNMSFMSNTYPDQLKNAIIRPIYKSGSHLEYTNYRPIAILSVVDKIIEKIIVSQISNFLDHNNVLSDTQHGFRKGRSTISALLGFADHVNEYLNSGKQVIALFIDYKKAFDTLDHDILLQAMDECGIRGPTNKWFRNYLSGRKIRTMIAGENGEEADMELGVPTGSVFGPLGYVMHVNSVANVVRKCQVFMYADDMCLLYGSKDISEVQSHVQEDFENITKWAHDNGIILNLLKTKCMHLYSPRNQLAKYMNTEDLAIIGHTYECIHNNKNNCNCAKLQYVEKFKYLGLLLDKNLNWKYHVNDVCNKLRSVLGKFYQLSGIVNKHTLRIVYYALADSLISYGLIVYGRTFMTYLKGIKNLQIRLLKFLVSKKVKEICKHDYDKLFAITSVLPIDKKVKFLISLEYYYTDMHKVMVENVYNTRRVSKKHLVQARAKNYYGERTSRYIVPRIFNKIDLLRQTPTVSKAVLKRKLTALLLESE